MVEETFLTSSDAAISVFDALNGATLATYKGSGQITTASSSLVASTGSKGTLTVWSLGKVRAGYATAS